jgi:hypothetical protein
MIEYISISWRVKGRLRLPYITNSPLMQGITYPYHGEGDTGGEVTNIRSGFPGKSKIFLGA